MRSRLIAGFVALLIMAPVGPAEARRARRVRVAKGVVYEVYKKRHPRLRMKTVTIGKHRVGDIRAVLGSGRLPGWERTSSIARRHRAVAAINGDYGLQSGRPVMAFAHAGRLVQTELEWGRNFAVAPRGKETYVGHPRTRIWLHAAGRDTKIGRINNGGPYGNQLAMFDRAGGHLERPPKYACSARLMPSGIPRPDAQRAGFVARYRVQRVKCTKGRLFPRDGRVVSARWRTRKAEVIRSLKKGSTVTFGWSLGWGPVREAIGGNPTLVEKGRIVVGNSRDPFFRRHPRTGVAVTKSGKVIFATVDGRRRKSVGMTLRQFARFFRARSARWALNLDGGGSTTMVVRGRIKNRPSDGRERAVSSALVILPRKKSSPQKKRKSTGTSARAWNSAATDSASTGGLARALDRAGVDLPRDLQRAAIRARH